MDDDLAQLDRSGGYVDSVPGRDFLSPSLGTMKWIPAGTFTMGSTRQADETPHQVALTNGYWLMEHEVTQGEYQAVMGKNPSNFTACGANCPVEQVSWTDAVAFAKAASVRDGVTYRLPTEAEWERAARGGQSFTYAGSDEVGAVAWTTANSGSTTHAVCGKHRNGYGLCDMNGNVWEWVSDLWSTYPGTPAGPAGALDQDLEGRSISSELGLRVDRGGDWDDGADYATVSKRDYGAPDVTYNNLGFRLVMSQP